MADAILRIILGILMIIGGLGWSFVNVMAAVMSDAPHDPAANTQFGVGLVVAGLGVGVLCLPLFFH